MRAQWPWRARRANSQRMRVLNHGGHRPSQPMKLSVRSIAAPGGPQLCQYRAAARRDATGVMLSHLRLPEPDWMGWSLVSLSHLDMIRTHGGVALLGSARRPAIFLPSPL